MSTLNCPPRLKHGDLIGIAAPAAPLWPAVPAAVNASFEHGLAMLRRLGFSVRVAPHALSPRAQPDVPAYKRAADLNALFGDPEVRAILCVAGGWGTNGVLPLLDWSAIERHPKAIRPTPAASMSHSSWQRYGGSPAAVHRSRIPAALDCQ